MHISSSVGWLGAVAGFLALAVSGLTDRDAQRVRAAYLAMDVVGWFVIVPSCFAALLSGVVQALGTPWGLLRHYWVLMKLSMTVLATGILLLHMRPLGWMAGVDSETILSSADVRAVRIQLVGDAAAALVVLLVTTTLSVYKPRGVTRFGRSRQTA